MSTRPKIQYRVLGQVITIDGGDPHGLILLGILDELVSLRKDLKTVGTARAEGFTGPGPMFEAIATKEILREFGLRATSTVDTDNVDTDVKRTP